MSFKLIIFKNMGDEQRRMKKIENIQNFEFIYEINKSEKKIYGSRKIRDKRGRLKKGAKIAERDSCDEDQIWRLHTDGKTVKEIVDIMNCSKSTVYDTIKEKNATMFLLYQNGWTIPKIAFEMKCSDRMAMQGIGDIEKKGIPTQILKKLGL